MSANLYIEIGDEGDAPMPFSEACMAMRVAGRRMRFKLVPDRHAGAMVQLLGDDGSEFSAPVTTGEAGVYRDGDRYYYTA